MFSLLKKLSQSKNHAIETTKLLLDTLNVKVTQTTLTAQMENHPDYPSILSISDILGEYGVENLSIKIDPAKLGDKEMPFPFIALIKGKKEYSYFFAIAKSLSGNSLTYFDPEKHKWATIAKDDFIKNWSSHFVLLIDGENAKGEKDYIQKLKEEQRLQAAKIWSFLALPIIVIIELILSLFNNVTQAFFSATFSLLTLVGTIVGGLLIWYEIDQYNPVLQQICSAGKKVNCGAILNSKASKIAGISWSVIGFTYFMGSLLILLFTGIIYKPTLFILTWLNVLAVLYIFYSIYYQWRVAKQWCLLCLSIQCVLALQLITAIIAGWHTIALKQLAFSTTFIISLVAAFAIPFIIVNLLLPAYRANKDSKRNKNELQRLKHNPQIFEALLTKQRSITEDTKGLGITLGNPNGKYKIIKVCNPYCGPCAAAHKPLETLLENNEEVQLQIIFTAYDQEFDISAKPVRHFLAINEKGNEEITKWALDDWYLSKEKNYEAFASRHPVDNIALDRQNTKMKAMRDWCDKVAIKFTPTFFISISDTESKQVSQYHQLPEMYNVADLKYYLAV